MLKTSLQNNNDKKWRTNILALLEIGEHLKTEQIRQTINIMKNITSFILEIKIFKFLITKEDMPGRQNNGKILYTILTHGKIISYYTRHFVNHQPIEKPTQH